jgi:hypothetical protein
MQAFKYSDEFTRIAFKRELSQPRNIYLWARDEILGTDIYQSIKEVMLAQAKSLKASNQ